MRPRDKESDSRWTVIIGVVWVGWIVANAIFDPPGWVTLSLTLVVVGSFLLYALWATRRDRQARDPLLGLSVGHWALVMFLAPPLAQGLVEFELAHENTPYVVIGVSMVGILLATKRDRSDNE